MVTIAQDSPDNGPTPIDTGYYFGYDPLSNSPLIDWYHAVISNVGVSGSGQLWPDGNGGFHQYPDDPTRIIVNFTDYADETDGINEHP